MLLRTKLIFSFLCVLALTVIVAFSGWYGMNEVTRLMRLSKNIEDGNSMIVDARYGQLSYIFSGNTDQIAYVKQKLSEAERFLKAGAAEIVMPERLRNTIEIIKQSDVFESNFQNFVELTQSIVEADKNLIAVGGTTVKALTTLITSSEKQLHDDFTEKNVATYTTLTEASNSLYQARLRALGFNIRPTADNASGALLLVDTSLDALNRVATSFTSPEGKRLVNELIATMTTYKKAVVQLTSNTLKRVEAQAIISKQVPAMISAANKLTLEIAANAQEVQQNANLQLGISTCLAVSLGILLTILLTRNVLNQLGRDPGVLTMLAKRVTNGDFDIADNGPSIGVYASLVDMVRNLKTNIETAQSESQRAQEQTAKAQEAMKTAEAAKREAESAKREGMLAAAERLDSVVSIVSSASTELSAQIEQSERGSSEQATRVTETATAMEEMNSTVLEVARNAGTASEATKAARSKAEEGAGIVSNTVASIQQVQKDSFTLKNDMAVLSKHAQDISQIMSVISDIADQTNLLALNAAIEAARAGEAGRGFAVVADEVRKLAEKTMTSTSDVGNAIKAIQQSAEKNMQQVDATVRNIESATAQAESSGVALREIVSLVDSAADQVNAIATASEEQSATSDEINRSITQVNQIASETARSMQEAARAVSDLADQSQVLSSLVHELKNA